MLSIRALLLAAILMILGVRALETSSNSTESSVYGCPTPRVRKSWDALSGAEKDTFKRAVALSMDNGLYERFLSMHRELVGFAEAHSSCGYIYWHRQYLLGFENMLRSLGPQFACVTVPYYDFVFDNLKRLTNQCSDIASCSSIVNELGSATPRSLPFLPHVSVIDGFPIPGRCDAAAPNNHFCELQNPKSLFCSHCVPRGPLHLSRFPCAVHPNNVRQILFKSASFKDMASRLEWGPSLFMHFHLLGAVAHPFVGPADPLFFPLHATLDAMHSIYHSCRVRPLGLDDAAAQTHPLVFEACNVAGVLPLKPTSPVKMNAIVNGLQVVDVRSPTQVTAPFFKGIPAKYYQLADIGQLGDHSYEYAFQGPLRIMDKTCGGCGKAAPSESCTVEHAQQNATADVEPVDATTRVFVEWRSALALQCSLQGLTSLECDLDIQKILVLHHHHCATGGLVDLSAAFKVQWGLIGLVDDQVRLLQDILAGRVQIKLTAFGQINQQFFKCRGDKI